MPTKRSTRGKALWELGDQQWAQDLKTGVFALIDFKGLGAPVKAYDRLDLAALTGARVSVASPDEGALYPGPFSFSPVSGKPLPDQPPPGGDAWLPPFGHDERAVLAKPRGLRLTEVPLSLPRTLTLESRPDSELRLPPPGNYQFLVGRFTTHAPGLLAIEFSKGLLYRWLPAARIWEEVVPADGGILGESSLKDAWGMAAPDPFESTRVFLPTDRGLTALSVNLIAPSYGTGVAGMRCVGAPALWQGEIYVPMQPADGRVAVHAFDPRTSQLSKLFEATITDKALVWTRPIVDRRQIIWMSSAGQLLVNQRGGEALEGSFLAWGPGIVPRFDLGSPYVSADGDVWQQCLAEEASGGRFVFVQLGRPQPDVRPTSSPRLSTGAATFKLETLLRANPWMDPEEGTDSQANEVIIPLLESLSSSTLLCVRVPSTSSVDSVFASDAPHTATFELRGDHDVEFARVRITRPWLTRPFVFAGCLYLYHPDLESLPGWRMS